MNAATGMPIFDAREDFARARRAAHVARGARWLGRRRRPVVPRTLDDGDWLPRGPSEARVIRLAEIVGTLEPTISFDADFRPATDLVRARWQRVALAHHRGVALAPIDVLQRADGYYIADGRHRVSVARALGHRDIDARGDLGLGRARPTYFARRRHTWPAYQLRRCAKSRRSARRLSDDRPAARSSRARFGRSTEERTPSIVKTAWPPGSRCTCCMVGAKSATG